jgi:ferritin-like protein
MTTSSAGTTSSPATTSSAATTSSPAATTSSPAATTSSPAATTSSPAATTSSPPVAGLRRREALAAAALAALAVPASAGAQRSDIAVLIRLVAREEAAAEAYGGLPGELLPRLHQDELDHAAALRTHLDALGRRPAPRGLDAPARRVLVAGDDERLDAAVDLESSLVEEYGDALAEIADPSVLQTAATILASHAQHLVRMRTR